MMKLFNMITALILSVMYGTAAKAADTKRFQLINVALCALFVMLAIFHMIS